MRLIELEIKNFKGVKDFSHKFDGENRTISGENGVGKTSTFDSILWLLFGKDSTGRAAFDIRPHTEDGKAIAGLILSVQMVLEVDGATHTLRKENREKIVKGVITGFTNDFWIDEVPGIKQKDFKKFIDEIIPEETFKMLADLSHFNDDNKTHWTKRRELLLTIAGEIGCPDGFDDLLKVMNGRDVDDYKKMLAERKKGYVKELKDTTPRIDECTLSLKDHKDEDIEAIEKRRGVLQDDLAKIGNDRRAIVDAEDHRQRLIEQRNTLNTSLITRAAVLENDKSGVKKYMDEKAGIETAIETAKTAITSAEGAVSRKEQEIKTVESELQSTLARKSAIVKEFDSLEAGASLDKCTMCGQSLPDEKKQIVAEVKKNQLDSIEERGKTEFQNVKRIKTVIEGHKAELAGLKDALEKENFLLQEAIACRTERFANLDHFINNNVTVKPEDDPEWVRIHNERASITDQIGEPVTVQLAEVEQRRADKNLELMAAKEQLINFDNAQTTRARIAELNTRETELGQLIAEVDAELQDVEDYKTTQNGLIEKAVNHLFKEVSFRMFKENINGSIEDDCTAIYRKTGTAYPDASTGEKIVMGLDVKDVLSKHFGMEVFTFIDNSRELTLPIESNSQIIRLKAVKGLHELTVEKK